MTPQKTNSLTWTWTAPHDFKRADIATLQAIEEAQAQTRPEVPPLTRSRIKKLFEEGMITALGLPLKANSKIKQGTPIQFKLPPPVPSELTPENQSLEILFEDEHLLVVNKPPGLTVHPSATQMTGTLVHGLLHQIQNLSGIGGVLRPGIVHRIDKNTSGSLVITKSDLAHTRLAETFARHEIERTYWALCFGSPNTSQLATPIQIKSLIGRNPSDRKKMSMDVQTGRQAITYYQKLKDFALAKKNPFASWLQATLETGRTHQVRVHLTGIGHSLLGDPTYGTPSERHTKWTALPLDVQAAVKELPGQALHARILGFKHPITGTALRFEAPLPASFEHLLSVLKKYE
jgi:23S rRNA pseudouridine1911/1915/1917 synthase